MGTRTRRGKWVVVAAVVLVGLVAGAGSAAAQDVDYVDVEQERITVTVDDAGEIESATIRVRLTEAAYDQLASAAESRDDVEGCAAYEGDGSVAAFSACALVSYDDSFEDAAVSEERVDGGHALEFTVDGVDEETYQAAFDVDASVEDDRVELIAGGRTFFGDQNASVYVVEMPGDLSDDGASTDDDADQISIDGDRATIDLEGDQTRAIAVASETDTDDGDADEDAGPLPGFTPLVALVALVVTAAVIARRR